MPPSETLTLKDLQERHQQLQFKQVAATQNQKNAEQRLDELRKEAIEKFGTGELEELQAKLKQMKADNASKLKKYANDLEKIEQQLESIDEKFSEEEA